MIDRTLELPRQAELRHVCFLVVSPVYRKCRLAVSPGQLCRRDLPYRFANQSDQFAVEGFGVVADELPLSVVQVKHIVQVVANHRSRVRMGNGKDDRLARQSVLLFERVTDG